MGSPLSALLAEIFMNHFERHLFNSNHKYIKLIYFWARYVDDIICIWTGTERQASDFLTFLNSLNTKIQFTTEIERNKTLNFLDITIRRDRDKLVYDIYRKPSYTDTIIHAHSRQSWRIKTAAFHNYIHRLINIPLSPENFNKEVNIIKTIAVNNGYKEEIIDQILLNKQKDNIRKFLYPVVKHSDQNTNWFAIPYIPKYNNNISKILKKTGIKTIHINKNSIGTMLINNKYNKIDNMSKSGVYQINCNECEAIYIGQSGRDIKTRIKEHKTAILYNKRNTGFAEHCIDNNHFPDVNNCKLLHHVNKGKVLDFLEILEIKKAISQSKNVTNSQTDFVNTPIINAAIKM